MRKFALRSAAAVSALTAFAGSVFAQSATPTTATALAQTIDLSDAKSAGLIVVGLMVAAGVVLWGARLILAKFKPTI